MSEKFKKRSRKYWKFEKSIIENCKIFSFLNITAHSKKISDEKLFAIFKNKLNQKWISSICSPNANLISLTKLLKNRKNGTKIGVLDAWLLNIIWKAFLKNHFENKSLEKSLLCKLLWKIGDENFMKFDEKWRFWK